MSIHINDYTKRIRTSSTTSNAQTPSIDIEKAKEGYQKYLSDSSKESKNIFEKALDSVTDWGREKLGVALLGKGLGNWFSNTLDKEAERNQNPDKPNDLWSEDQKNLFGYKYLSSPEEAYRYAVEVNNSITQQRNEKLAEEIGKDAASNFGTAALHTVNSIVTAPLSLVEYVDKLGDTAKYGTPITSPIYMSPTLSSEAAKSGIASKLNEYGTIDESVPIFGGKGLGDAYGLGTSIAQSAYSGVIGGGSALGASYTLATYFGQSATLGIEDALSRGANGKQALAYGTAVGLAEAIPEMISAKSLIGITKAEGVQNVFKAVLKQAGEEATEEFTTSVLNEVADRWIMGGKSQYYMTVQELMGSGMSAYEAENKALSMTLENIAFDVISGAVSGGISGAGAAGISNINQKYLQTDKNARAKTELTPKQNELIAEGKKYEQTAKRAASLEKKIADGKELSGYELRMLASEVAMAEKASNVDTVRKAVIERMKAEGVSDSEAKRLGEIALKKALGTEKPSVLEEGMLKRNKAALKVYNQMDAKNMESGMTDSDWVNETPLAQLRRDTSENEATLEYKSEARNGQKNYKINPESLEGKFAEPEGKITYEKTSEDSRIHTEEISTSLTKEDIAELSALEKLANGLGIDIHVYESKLNKDGSRSYTDKDGNVITDSGYYDPNDKSIHIDLRAGDNGEGTMRYTASHELVHFVKDVSSEHFDALEKLVTEALIEGGASIEKLIDYQRRKAIANGQNLTEAQLREEMVAEACQSFLASETAIDRIKALKTENRGFWNTLKRFFTSLFTKINRIYKTVEPDSYEGRYIANMRNDAKRIRDAFMEGVSAAGEKYSSERKALGEGANVKVNSDGEFVQGTTKDRKLAKQASAKKDIRHKIRYPSFTQTDITNNIEAIADMTAVAKIDSAKLKKTGKRPIDIFNEYFQSLGNNIYTDVFGDIALPKASAKSEIRHGITSEKIAAIEAIPEVIKNGRVIFQKEKEAGVERIVICAPIEIGTTEYYMGVMLQRDSRYQRLYLHNVLSIEIAKEAISSSKENLLTTGALEDENHLSMTSILQKAIAVKISKQKSFENSSGKSEIRSKTRTTDNLGNELTEAQISYFKDSKIRDSKGNLMVLYHGTKADFNEFKKGDVGYHFGTKGAARGRVGYGKNVTLKEVYLNINNPIVFNDDLGSWDADYMLTRELYDRGILTQSEAETVLLTDSKLYKRTTEAANKKLAEVLLAKGYDGIQYTNTHESKKDSTSYIIFDSNQAKLITNTNPTTSKDIRHKARSTVTSGQYAQMKANLSHGKVYSKASAMALVSKLAPGIRNRSFEDLSNKLWEGLNTYTSLEDKAAFASDMSEMFIDRMMVDTLTPNPEWDEASENLSYLKPAITSINFTDAERTEIRHILDKDGLSRILGRWGYKSSGADTKRRYDLDVFITDISREMPGMEHLADMHPVDALMEIDKLYSDLSEVIKQKYESAYKDFSDEEINEIKRGIATDIMKAYRELGEQTKISKYLEEKLEYYQSRVDYWKAENAKTEAIARWNGILSTKALHIRDLKKGAFYNATQYPKKGVFKDSIEQLAKIQWRGNISHVSIRKVFADLKSWYSKENPMLYKDGESDNLYSDTIAAYIEKIADTEKGDFDENTYAMVYDVMNHLYTMMRNYNKVFRAGRWEDAPTLVDSYRKIMEKTARDRGPAQRIQERYATEFLEPMAIARRADGYNPDGFFTQTIQDLRRASIDASVGEMNLRKDYDAFIDNNKKYLANAAKDTVNYRGFDIPKLHLIGLYMTMKRKHARAGLALNGFEYAVKNKWWDSEDYVKVPGYVPLGDNVTQKMIDDATDEQMRVIESSLTDTDKEYIRILEKLFNEDLKALKIERDMERQGYTNATLDYYYPIMRGAIAENVDTAKISDQNRATNASFNKNTVAGSKQYLVIISADSMVNRHITDMCKYYYMSQAIENYNVLYNCDISDNANNPVNIAKIVKENKIWEKDVEYFKKLVADMQGIRDQQTTFERYIEGARGAYAKFALGANLKVLFTQFSSMIAAGDIISYKNILSPKALKISSADVDKYCPLAGVRNYDKTILRAMTLTDKFGKLSEAFTFGISKVDRFVITRLFASCQLEAQAKGLGALGTEENKIAAGKLLEEVIIETQQNSFATERSQAMRSKHELLKAITMFTADGMKIVGRMYDAFGELSAAKKSGDESRIKSAKNKVIRSVAVAASIAVFMSSIAVMFNWIYDRDEDEDENKLLSFTLDTVGNFIGALPFISDLYDYCVNGFEVESVAFDTLNNIFASINNMRKDLVSIVSGDGERSIQDINRDLRTALYGVGQATGLPFRNIYNLTRGIIGNFSSSAGYKLDSKFYETSLASDLEKAIESGDNSKISYIMALIYDERVSESVSENQIDEIVRLLKSEYEASSDDYNLSQKILPKDIPTKIKRNGVEYVLTAEQKDAFLDEYSKVIDKIDNLISSSFYSSGDDERKIYLIDYYHDKYYDMAVNKALGITDAQKAVYNLVGFEKYAEYAYSIKDIQSDKDKNGNTISGSKKEKVIKKINSLKISTEKKLLLIAYSGYKLDEADKSKLLKYLNRSALTSSEKKELANKLGFELKYGKFY